MYLGFLKQSCGARELTSQMYGMCNVHALYL